ncbi:carbamoyl phosphate synthase small subunit [Bacillus thermotolerans]|uniref:Carbamoyl phosphate synthase small chain n=1 Tax=Bacillus thermotolerans TaxID=1221996 RepID=A0A0F5I9K2_BACTR|nr:carbamoyl phosphate synthase small subunit [Bacillus thermotolerans]KKB39278.1 Carbamoyl-phosphate synthase small chain [Bacillus thermotolerans]KKB42294.1 Carbamoyl-phosphate synthase small chain [Bacillus thermotolerans]
MKKQLILEDGTILVGKGFGSEGDTVGEVVFTTGMTGYQEVLSDPSYCGQIVTFTYPLVGNYGINRDDFETIQPAVKGLIVKEAAEYPSNFRSEMSLNEYLKMKNIPAISGIDTRKLTRVIRQHGTLKGAIVSINENAEEVIHRLRATVLPKDQVDQVSTKSAYPNPGRGYRVVLMDFGMKHGILRELNNRDCDVVVVPHDTTAEEILQFKPDGIMLSNGPGNPKDVPHAIETVRELIGQVPIFGICLGHQLFALASGADTFKLKFGHRGSNHPVKDLATGKTALTSQNHSYAVNEETLKNTELEVTHVALNDGTIEGVAHKVYPAFSVQYHPEASPGPEDDNHLFDRFINMMKVNAGKEIQHA